MMNICYHCSDLFAPMTGISITSLFENNKNCSEITVYIIEKAVSEKNKKVLLELAEKYKRKIVFIPMPDVNKKYSLGLKQVQKKWLFDSYVRLLLDGELPQSLDRVLYLDGDTIVNGNIEEFYNIDLEGNLCAGVSDYLSEEYYELFGLSKTATYCNSGMILIDLDGWRKQSIADKVRECLQENNGYIFFMEQSTWNMVLQDKIKIVHPRYNLLTTVTELTYEEAKTLRQFERGYSKKEIAEAIVNPVIIHFTSFFLLNARPWEKDSNHSMRKYYEKYKAISPWKELPALDVSRTAKGKMKKFIVEFFPKFILLPCVSWVYNVWRINNIKKDMGKAREA